MNVVQLGSGGSVYNVSDANARSATHCNIFDVAWFENGAISETNGTAVNSSERIRSVGYLPTTAKLLRSTNSNMRFMLYGYSQSGVYVGALQQDGTFGTSAFAFASIDMTEIYAAHPIWNFKVVLRLSGGSVQVDTVADVYFDTLIYDIPNATAKIDGIERATSANMFDASDFENGSINYANGANFASTSRIRTKGYIPDTANLFYSTDANIRFQLFAWDASGNYIGAYYQRQITTADAGTFAVLDMAAIRTNSNYKSYKYKVVILSVNGNVTVDNVSGVYIDSIIQAANETHIFERVQNFSHAININSFYLWETGGINLVTGVNAVNASRARTRGFLPTNAGIFSLGSSAAYRGFFIAAYDVDGTYRGAYKNDGTFVRDGSESGYTTFDFTSLYTRFPGYRYRVALYVRGGGENITPSEFEGWTITNTLHTKASKLKVIQYNAGKWNMGYGHDDPHVTNPADKIANYKEFFANEDPDFLFMQECTEYIDTGDTIGTDTTLFDPFFLSKSYFEKETAIKGQYPISKTQFSYLHTSGDNPSWCVYGECDIDGKKVAVVSGVLNVSAPDGINHSEQQIRALTKMTTETLQGGLGFNLSNYDYVIVGMDTNCLSQDEADTVKAFMEGKGYTCANWGYLGVKDTYNLSANMYRAIDNIFVKGNVRITNFSVPSVYDALASDHFPVISEFRLF